MQMYLVRWQTNYANAIDTGSAVIGATSMDDARNSTLYHYQLPGSRTQIEVKRLKPPIMEVERHQRPRTQEERSRQRMPPGTPLAPLLPFSVRVSAMVHARDEDHAVHRLNEKLRDPANHAKLMIDCKQVIESQKQLKPLESVELYQPRNVLGGKGRP